MANPHIQVLLDDAELTTDVQQALEHVGADVVVGDFEATDSTGGSHPFDARLIVSGGDFPVNDGKLSRLDELLDLDPCATLVLSGSEPAANVLPRAHSTGRAVDFAAGIQKGELADRLSAMCDSRAQIADLRKDLAAAKRREARLEARLSMLQDDLRQGAELQRDLLPSSLPVLDGGCLDVMYRPASTVSGDLYDIARLDTEWVAISLVDATGHGVPAAILSAFVERSLSGRGTARIPGESVEPDEVLRRLNRDILDLQLAECHFIAALFAVYDEGARLLRWARGGAPYPILIRQGQKPRSLKTEGAIIGVHRNARFEVAELPLEPGDTVIFHTDGLDAAFMADAAGGKNAALERTRWFQSLGQQTLGHHLREVDDRLADIPPDDAQLDDVTIVTLQLDADPADEAWSAASPALVPAMV